MSTAEEKERKMHKGFRTLQKKSKALFMLEELHIKCNYFFSGSEAVKIASGIVMEMQRKEKNSILVVVIKK